MGECFIMRRGGSGLADAFAAIAVTYPAGSTCTCTNGTKTLKAKDTSGSFLFLIPSTGTWTVRCTDGTKTASKAVSITKRYQTVSVVLLYELYLYKRGDQCTGTTGGWANSTIANAKMTFNSNNISGSGGNVFTAKAVDLTKFNTLLFVAKCTNVPYTDLSQTMRMGLMGSSDISTHCLWEPSRLSINCQISAPKATTAETSYTLDISKISGAYHTAFSYNVEAGISGTATLYEVLAR